MEFFFEKKTELKFEVSSVELNFNQNIILKNFKINTANKLRILLY